MPVSVIERRFRSDHGAAVPVRDITVDPDGAWYAASGVDGGVRIWSSDLDYLAAKVPAIAGRELSDSELRP